MKTMSNTFLGYLFDAFCNDKFLIDCPYDRPADTFHQFLIHKTSPPNPLLNKYASRMAIGKGIEMIISKREML